MNYTARIKPRSLSLATFNAAGLSRQLDLVVQFLRVHPVDILLVQETFLKPSQRDPRVPNYNLIRNDRLTALGGTLIYYKRSLHCVPLDPPALDEIEASMCRISMTGHQSITLASVYLSPKGRLLESDLRTLLSTGSAVIIAGDLNSKHPRWNSRIKNTRGKVLDRLASRNSLDFEILAPRTATRFPPTESSPGSPEVLDIALIKGITLHLRSIEVLSELDSDHRPVVIQLGPDPDLRQPVKTIIDWKKLSSELSSTDSPQLNDIPDEIDSADTAKMAASKLTDFVQQKIEGCSREIPIRPGERWQISEELRDLIRRKNAQTRAHDKYPTAENKRKLNALKREVKARFTELRNDYYGRRLGELTPSHTAYWSWARSLRCENVATIPPLNRPNLPPAFDDSE